MQDNTHLDSMHKHGARQSDVDRARQAEDKTAERKSSNADQTFSTMQKQHEQTMREMDL
jgi:hypothetical protein